MSDQVVTFSQSAPLGYITLDRPPANSYEINYMRQLEAAIDAADGSGDAKVIVLRSASERFFCAGADIKAFAANTPEANMEMIRTAHRALDKMGASRKVFIASINGHALGGGLEMTLACDLRIVAEGRYQLGLPEVTLGLLPGNGGTQRLPRLIGPNKALEMMIQGQTVGPEDALQLGIVNQVVPAGELAERTDAYAKKLAAGPTLAIGSIKQAVYQGIHKPLSEGLALERQLMEPLFHTEDAKEGFNAFAEKRQPQYKGR